MADAELLEKIITEAVAKAKQHNYDLEFREDHEKAMGTFTEERPRMASSSLVNAPRTDEFVYNSRGRRLHIRTEWTEAWKVLGLDPIKEVDRVPTKGVVIVIHGLNGHTNRPSTSFLANRYYRAGYHPVVFDFQGHGYSDRFVPGEKNAYYDHTRALIDDYTEMIDDAIWIISKLFVSEKEKRTALNDEIKRSANTVLSQYYPTHGGRKRKGRADTINKADLEAEEGYNSDTDDMYHDFHIRHRFAIGTPLFLSGTSMGGGTALLMSAILQKMKEAVNKAYSEGNSESAIFTDMNAISLEDPRKKVVLADNIESDDDEEEVEEEPNFFYNDEEDSEGLKKMLIDPIKNLTRFIAKEFSSVKDEVKEQMKTAVAPIKKQVDEVKEKVRTKLDTVKAKVDNKVRAVEKKVKGKIMDIYEGRVGVHGMDIEIEGTLKHSGSDQYLDRGGSLDAMLDYIDSKEKPSKNIIDPTAGEDRGDVIYYNDNEYPRDIMIHLAQIANKSYTGTCLISPAIAVDTPHPALVAFLSYVAVPFFPATTVPAFLRRNDDSAHWVSVNWRRYNNSDGYPDGLSWGENVKFRTAYTVLGLIEAVRSEIPKLNFPYQVIHDPLDKVTSFDGVVNLMHTAGCDRPEQAAYEIEINNRVTSSSSAGAADLIECERIKGGHVAVPRRNRIGQLVPVPGGRHDILSNFTDDLIRHTVNFFESKVAKGASVDHTREEMMSRKNSSSKRRRK